MAEGWIKLHRRIFDSDTYFKEKFCRNMAWVDLLLLANHEDSFFRVRGARVEVKRGQCGYSMKNLAVRWKWSRMKVKRFLNELETDHQIEQQNFNTTTLITILNYEVYQGNEPQVLHQVNKKRAGNGTPNEPQTSTNKNEKNDKKEDIGASAPSYKKFTEKEFYTEIAKFANEFPKDMLRNFYDYWREPAPSGRMKFQLKPTWSTKLRLQAWKRRSQMMERKPEQEKQPTAPPLIQA